MSVPEPEPEPEYGSGYTNSIPIRHGDDLGYVTNAYGFSFSFGYINGFSRENNVPINNQFNERDNNGDGGNGDNGEYFFGGPGNGNRCSCGHDYEYME
ncbi:uncharacterized protein LOC114250038 [Bombyx mandarina]|uniref:Uncharacterized protein n=2 Tax=Bombyx TaxID=7090 RepID=A0A8R2C7X0_BOMMO|nr:uncharacterized protein LOC101739325 [Bombyx mori]XP_028039576.1 uncharacterized protein LOC114250038 [Bombyx mandarina]